MAITEIIPGELPIEVTQGALGQLLLWQGMGEGNPAPKDLILVGRTQARDLLKVLACYLLTEHPLVSEFNAK